MLKVGRSILESEDFEEQKDRPEGRESTGCDTDIDIRADVGWETSKNGRESVVSVPPVEARRDAFL